MFDSKAGSRWQHIRDDAARTVVLVGHGRRIRPAARLVLTWADPDDAGDKSKHTRVSFDLERIDDDMVHLSVTHGELEED